MFSEKLGGNSYNQTLGITVGSLLFTIVMSFVNPLEWSSLVRIVFLPFLKTKVSWIWMVT
ncbi:hypothetical protein QUF81_24795 [Peribacillus simplex]|uniref:hypothetical protein n=1 Tax=Peribacillus simplex TaxID=1478 RepID=UPI000AB5CD7F|nr:hypothetical protein [Peribacillus simplex]MDM5296305.1 hypothetical protein [Peribacillus simplex]